MLSKNKAKFIRSLQLKKHREESGCFVVEGKKGVLELLRSDFQVRTVACTETFWAENKKLLEGKRFEIDVCRQSELESVSSLKTNGEALAAARMKPKQAPPAKLQGLTLALDDIRDPGNMGALLRIADWYGASAVIASEETTDFYNPKVLQASMGSFCRVTAHYVQLDEYLRNVKLPVYAADAKGEVAHDFAFEENCILLLGNESHGISPSLLPYVRKSIGIPAYGIAESLNVSTAAAVLCDNYRRLMKLRR